MTTDLDPRVLNLARALAAILAPAPATSPDDLVPLAEAAKLAATSARILREAIRQGDVAAYGKQRDRSVRRGDLEAWIASRRARPVALTQTQSERVRDRLRGKGKR